MIGNALLIAAAFPTTIGVFAFVIYLWEHRSHDAEYNGLVARFLHARRDVDFDAKQAELRLRTAAARLRASASRAVLRDPRRAHTAIAKAIEVEVVSIAHLDQTLAIQFGAWARGATMDELLYPLALRAAHAAATPRRRHPLRHHDLAALRTRG